MAQDYSALLKGKTPEQKAFIKYFCAEGCIGRMTCIKDEEYEGKVMAKLNGLNLRKRALDKIGLDEDQVKEIPPVFFHGYEFDDNKTVVLRRVGGDGRLRSSQYSGTWLFFSADQVYMYSYRFDMLSESKKETTEEYFYRDITNFSTSSESIEVDTSAGCGCGGGKIKKETRDYSRFGLVVPGDKFFCSTTGVPDAEDSITAMKSQLRAKKSEQH